MLRPGISVHSLRSMSNSLRNLNESSENMKDELLNDEKRILQMSLLSANPVEKGIKNAKIDKKPIDYIKNTPEIIITDENLVTRNELDILVTDEDHIINRKEANSLTQVYLRRWVILFIFSFISLLSALNWIEYNIIQDVTVKFYNESLPEGDAAANNAVNWFSMVYMLFYIPLVFPAMFLLDKKGLKFSITLGGLLTTIGAIIKCFAVRPELFLVAMLGQILCAIAQAFTLSVPARLSALWFGPSQIALATSVCLFVFLIDKSSFYRSF